MNNEENPITDENQGEFHELLQKRTRRSFLNGMVAGAVAGIIAGGVANRISRIPLTERQAIRNEHKRRADELRIEREKIRRGWGWERTIERKGKIEDRDIRERIREFNQKVEEHNGLLMDLEGPLDGALLCVEPIPLD